jgi:hypothetical protein
MTKLLERAIAEAKKLHATEQDALAAIILEELHGESAWEQRFATTQSQLSRLADKVREDVRSGRVSQQGMDEL